MATNPFGSGFGTDNFTAPFRTPSFRKKAENSATLPFYGEGGGNDGLGPDPFSLQDSELFKASKQTALDQLGGKVDGFDAQANEARESMKTAQAIRGKSVREQLMAQGMKDTGKFLEEGIIAPAEQQYRERLSLERGLAGDRGQLSMAQQQAGQASASNLMGLQLGERQQKDQSAQGWAGLGIQRELGLGGLNIQEKQLTQQASQFKDEQSFKRWATQAGFDDAAAARAWQSNENNQERSMTRELEYAGLSVQEKQLAQQGEQFKDRLSFDKWATQAGLDDASAARVWQANQNLQERESREKVAFAGLGLEERRLAQEASQFTDKLQFDMWSVQKGLDENEKQRVWQGVQNDRSLKQQYDIASMQNDTERWKTERQENLTRAGWDQESAMQQAQFEYDANQRRLDRGLQREVEAGRLSLEEKQMAQQALQFKDELSFKKWATQAGLDNDAANRVWQSAENAADRAMKISEASADRQLTMQVEMGRLSMEDKKLAQDALQFEDELEFKTWATKAGLDDSKAARTWQTVENARDRAFEQSMQLSAQEFEMKGIQTQGLMQFLQSFPPEQAASVMQQLAQGVGIDLPTVDWGKQESQEVVRDIQSGTLPITTLISANRSTSPYYSAYNSLLDTSPNVSLAVKLVTRDGANNDGYEFEGLPAAGQLFVSDREGRKLLQFVNSTVDKKAGGNETIYTFLDVGTGKQFKYRATKDGIKVE